MSKFKPGSGSTVIPERRPMPRPAPVHPDVPVAIPVEDVKVAEEETETGGIRKAAVFFTLLFVFLRFSYLHEWITARIGLDTHLLLLVGVCSVFSVLISGRLGDVLSNKIFLMWLGFAFMMCLATITSSWKGGSFSVVFPYLRTTLVLVAVIPAVTLTTKGLTKMLCVIGMAAVVPILLGFLSNDYRSGRLELADAGASISNSNDFAALLMLLMPALAFWTLRKKTNLFSKIMGLGFIGMALFLVLGTGSRGALIALVVTCLYLVKVGTGKVRLAILVGIPLVMAIVIPLLPKESSRRLESLFDSSAQTEESYESKLQREELLKASIRMTFEHPLLGVGPATFDIVEAEEAKEIGAHGMWHNTHNTYTQVSAECGIPALCFYLAAIVMSFMAFSRGRKSEDPDLRAMCQILSVMLVMFSICMFFLSQAYGFGFPVLGGLAIAVDRLLQRQSALTTAA